MYKIKNTVEKWLIIRNFKKNEEINVFLQKHTRAAYNKIVIYLTQKQSQRLSFFHVNKENCI